MVLYIIFLLNFAEYRRSGRFGYKMVPPGRIQIPGFEGNDTYIQVISKAARGLGLEDIPNHRLIIGNIKQSHER